MPVVGFRRKIGRRPSGRRERLPDGIPLSITTCAKSGYFGSDLGTLLGPAQYFPATEIYNDYNELGNLDQRDSLGVSSFSLRAERYSSEILPSTSSDSLRGAEEVLYRRFTPYKHVSDHGWTQNIRLGTDSLSKRNLNKK